MISYDERLRRLIAGSLQNAQNAITGSRRASCPLSVCLAMLTMESGGANLFGADPGGTALPRQWFDTPVTRSKYLYYRRRVRKGMIGNGVGPAQLTSLAEQAKADRAGGCWDPQVNIRVGCEMLVALYNQTKSWQLAFQHYNGSGPAAEAYGHNALALQQRWHQRFVEHGLV